MLSPTVIHDLGLKLPPVVEGQGEVVVTTSGDFISDDVINIAGLSEEDKNTIELWDEQFSSISQTLQPYLLKDTPRKQDFLDDLAKLDLIVPPEEFMSSSLMDLTEKFTATKGLRVMLACNAFLHPSHSGTGYSRAYMGTPYTYADGKWGYIQGGMGVITQELERVARSHGVQIKTNTPAVRIVHDGKDIQGIETADGKLVVADFYLCGTDYNTYQRLIGQMPVPMRSHGYGVSNIHVKLKRLPEFTVVKQNGLDFYPSSLSLLPDFDEVETSHAAYINGAPYDRHVISIGIPTLVDPTRAPEGKHLMCIHVDHTPLSFSSQGWTTEDRKTFFNQIAEEIFLYAPDFKDCVEDWKAFVPQDLKESYGAEGMHCFHGDLGWEHAFEDRIPGLSSGPETRFPSMFLCGSATHPGGTVTGAPGYRCARAILKILKPQ
jgi:phytoene dehydrogenase-like protein